MQKVTDSPPTKEDVLFKACKGSFRLGRSESLIVWWDTICADSLGEKPAPEPGGGGGGGTQLGKGYRLRSDRWRAVAVTTRDG